MVGQANAQAALPIAAKYCMQRPIQRYAEHVRANRFGSALLSVKETIQWLDLFCHTCKTSDPVIAKLAAACRVLTKAGAGLADAAAIITGTESAYVMVPSAGAVADLHPLTIHHLVSAAFCAMPDLKRLEYHCDKCSAKRVYWEGKSSRGPTRNAPAAMVCGACKSPMKQFCF